MFAIRTTPEIYRALQEIERRENLASIADAARYVLRLRLRGEARKTEKYSADPCNRLRIRATEAEYRDVQRQKLQAGHRCVSRFLASRIETYKKSLDHGKATQ